MVDRVNHPLGKDSVGLVGWMPLSKDFVHEAGICELSGGVS